MDQQLPEQPNFTQPKADVEITLKDIILKIQEWWSIVWPKKNLIIAGALGVGLFAALFTKFTVQRQYTASHQIIFKGESSGGMSSALRLASSLGLGGGIGGSGGGAAGTVAFYITSNENIERALLLEEGPGKLIDLYIQPFLEDDEEFAADYNAKFLQDQRFTDSVLSVVRYYILE